MMSFPISDMVTRRTVLSGVTTGAIATLAGCSEVADLVLDGTAEFSAQPAEVPQSELVDKYTFDRQESYGVDQSIDQVDREVVIDNWLTAYTGTVTADIGSGDTGISFEEDLAWYVIVSSPQAEVVGQNVNPAANLEPEQIIDFFGDRLSEQVGIGAEFTRDEQGDMTTDFLDTTVDVARFTADPSWNGQISGAILSELDPNLALYVTPPTDHDDDLLFGMGAYPFLPEERKEETDIISDSAFEEIADRLDQQGQLQELFGESIHPADPIEQ